MVAFWKPFAVVLLGVVLTSSGQILFAKCVKDRSRPRSSEEARYWQKMCEALGDHRAMTGVLCMLVAFPLGLLAIEMADVSVAVPLGAVSYVLATFLAKFYLDEHVGALRWLGVITIVVGTVLIGISATHDATAPK